MKHIYKYIFLILCLMIINISNVYAQQQDNIPIHKYNAVYYINAIPGSKVKNGFNTWCREKYQDAKEAYFNSASNFFNIYEGRNVSVNYVISMLRSYQSSPDANALSTFQKLKLDKMDFLVMIYVDEIPHFNQAEGIVKMDVYDLNYSPDKPCIVYHGEQTYLYNTQRYGHSIEIRNIWSECIQDINCDLYKKLFKPHKKD